MTTATQPATYSSAEVCRQTGLTYRQLDYWCRHGWLKPESYSRGNAKPGNGPGWDRRWTQAELNAARMMARLVDLGITPQQAADVARNPDKRLRWLTAVWVVSQ
jgi:DNA-binding transcriptional MerR regulator